MKNRHKCYCQEMTAVHNFKRVIFRKSIINTANTLIIFCLARMMLLQKASYTIISAKQFVLVVQHVTFPTQKWHFLTPKQFVLQPQTYALYDAL